MVANAKVSFTIVLTAQPHTLQQMDLIYEQCYVIENAWFKVLYHISFCSSIILTYQHQISSYPINFFLDMFKFICSEQGLCKTWVWSPWYIFKGSFVKYEYKWLVKTFINSNALIHLYISKSQIYHKLL